MENEQQGDGGGIGVMLGAFATLGRQADQHHGSLMGALASGRPIRRVLPGTLTASGTGTDIIISSNQSQMGPAQGRLWMIRKLVIAPVPATTPVTSGGTPVNASGAFAAAAAGSAALPAGASITGFTITAGPIAAAALTAAVTVTNVPNGPLTYNFDFPNAGDSPAVLNITFPVPLPATGGAPTVSIAAAVGGSAGNITVYGTSAASSVTADVYVGASADVNNTDFEALEALAAPLPFINTYGTRRLIAYPGEVAYAILHGAAANVQFVMTMEADEYVISEVEAMHA